MRVRPYLALAPVALALLVALRPAPAGADPVLVQQPADGSLVGPGPVTFEAVAPPGTAKVIFFVDQYRVASFDGPGDHVLVRALSQPGARSFSVRALDAAGALIDAASTTFTALAPGSPAPGSTSTGSTGGSPDLVPPTDRGAISWYDGWSGRVKLNDRTVTMLANARAWLAANGGCDPDRASVGYVVQGSYHKGLSASAGTHDGGGAMDLHMVDLSHDERLALVHALREAGFAAWVRFPPVFPWHIHAIAIGDPDLSPSAEHQVHEYFAGEDGLADHAADFLGGPIVKPWMAAFR